MMDPSSFLRYLLTVAKIKVFKPLLLSLMTSTRKFASEKNDKFHAPKNFLTLFSTLAYFEILYFCSALNLTNLWHLTNGPFNPTKNKIIPSDTILFWNILKYLKWKKQVIKNWFTCEPNRLLKSDKLFLCFNSLFIDSHFNNDAAWIEILKKSHYQSGLPLS